MFSDTNTQGDGKAGGDPLWDTPMHDRNNHVMDLYARARLMLLILIVGVIVLVLWLLLTPAGT